MINRRDFLKWSTMAGTGATAAWGIGTQGAMAHGTAGLPATQTRMPAKADWKFQQPLPTFYGSRVDGSQRLSVSMEEFQQPILPIGVYPEAFKKGTVVWGYAISNKDGCFGPSYPAYTIESWRWAPTKVCYENNLIKPHLQQYLPVDQTLHWADPLNAHNAHTMNKPMPKDPYSGPVPAVVHLHGGEVPSIYDGGPDAWFTPNCAKTGPGFFTDTYVYPNQQEAATLWFHDHALGVTRLNVYAGLAGFYLLRDDYDTGEINNPLGLPGGPYEAEIVIQDRMFDTNGQLYFPRDGVNPKVHPFWIPEFFGDVIVVNGKAWPCMDVEPRRYRFRLLNGSNARFYRLQLAKCFCKDKDRVWQIGTDGGLLDTPVKINELLLAPGERADIIVDFTGLTGKDPFTLTNDAPAPFPMGDDPTELTGEIMQFRATLPLSRNKDRSRNPAKEKMDLRGCNKIVRLAQTGKKRVRQLTLNEHLASMPGDDMGMPSGLPLEVLVNNSKWAAEVSETPVVGSTELWEIINLTMDAHPIHLHLVQFQLLNRQDFDADGYIKFYEQSFASRGGFKPAIGPPNCYDTPNTDGALGGNPSLKDYLPKTGQPSKPLVSENGWKDTVVAHPGQVTRLLIRWAPQELKVNEVGPGDNEFPFDPSRGPGYVWHCHIIDHEDNEMMRPMTIKKDNC